MAPKEFAELCSEIVEFLTKKLLYVTKSESHTLKIMTIGINKAIEQHEKDTSKVINEKTSPDKKNKKI